MGNTVFEKRGIATSVPEWDPAKCLQCNQCSYVCPHAAIRPYLLNAEEAAGAPADFKMTDAKGKGLEGLKFSVQVSTMDCMGCGSCVNVCPAKDKAITMVSALGGYKEKTAPWDYAQTLSDKGDLIDPKTVKGSQFRQPLVEFSGACAGCGETPYAKLITQLYGDKAYWINAIGCSMAWSAAMPSFCYTTNKEGHGPSYFTSLFENQAEAGLGVYLGVQQRRNQVRMQAEAIRAFGIEEVNKAVDAWFDTYEDIKANDAPSRNLTAVLEKVAESSGIPEEAKKLAVKMLKNKDQFSKKSIWLFGGDGWAYDIGFGGLDHVIASGKDLNIFIVDTEVYSNTGGQASKATPLGASAQFQSAGKVTAKKELGKQMMTYGNVYVAQVAMGADMNQLIKAVTEAEAFHGPSIVVAYAPCISHGIRAGMSSVQTEMKRVVQAGLWTLFRYNPLKKDDPLTIDSPAPSLPYRDFIKGENRYASLLIKYPERAEKLFAEAESMIQDRYDSYVRLAESFKK